MVNLNLNLSGRVDVFHHDVPSPEPGTIRYGILVFGYPELRPEFRGRSDIINLGSINTLANEAVLNDVQQLRGTVAFKDAAGNTVDTLETASSDDEAIALVTVDPDTNEVLVKSVGAIGGTTGHVTGSDANGNSLTIDFPIAVGASAPTTGSIEFGTPEPVV